MVYCREGEHFCFISGLSGLSPFSIGNLSQKYAHFIEDNQWKCDQALIDRVEGGRYYCGEDECYNDSPPSFTGEHLGLDYTQPCQEGYDHWRLEDYANSDEEPGYDRDIAVYSDLGSGDIGHKTE